ncbi:kinase-like domain-containing protein [Apiospora marii]|uniref:Kinase-like domain-containing protein n=1 Tax=Apiospora marii TaxID=335849 RepID=A0ABR1R0D2_9PEZI
MELIPYTSREGREIVLRHHDALVVRDPSSQRLEIRGLSLTECPTCHQSLRPRSPSPERRYDNIPSSRDKTYVDPNYFRMLQAGHNEDNIRTRAAPPSPIRRLTQPALPIASPAVQDAEFVSSTPIPPQGGRIRRDAFSPQYFKTFFVEERELGRGGKGVVLLVRHEIDGCHLGHFACKRVPVGDDHAWLEKVLIEVELLAKLSHPNLVSYRHVWLEDVKLHRFGPSVACAFILQQYCNGGDLLQYIVGDQPKETTKEQLKAQMRRRSKSHFEKPVLVNQQRRLSFDEIFPLFRDIVSGLAYLHAANYIHRDLKPSNCLLHRENGNLTCLISDFGEVQPENAKRKSTGTTGTISYCAPEVLIQDAGGNFGNFTTKSDVFSLGMILYFLCFNRLPYINANTVQEELEDIDQLRAEISHWKGFQDERRERPDLPSKLYYLLKRMLALNPSDRPSATEVLTAMNQESNATVPRREPRSSSPTVGLEGRRIHNLDSPMPGTPVPDPNKQRFRDTAAEGNIETPESPMSISSLPDHSPPSSHDGMHKHMTPTTPRRRSHALIIPRAANGFAHQPSEDEGAEEHHHSQPSPPLLMAPPRTVLEDITHKGILLQHRACYIYHQNADTILFLVRFALFVVKMSSFAQICWPYMAKPSVSLPLVSLAALDLGLPRRQDLIRWRPQSTGYQTGNLGRLNKSWSVTSILLVIHFAVLASIHRWGSVCAGLSGDYKAYW